MFTAYGWWIAGYVEDYNKGVSYLTENRKMEYDFKRETPGKKERRPIYKSDDEYNKYKGESETFDGRLLKKPKSYFPGILFVFNAKSKKYIEWNTGQGDSEILLVQNDEVYYRVNDKIYRAQIINGEKLGESELLIQDERVPDIHWAFITKK